VPITTHDVSSSPNQANVNSIQHYVKNFVSDLRQFGGFLQVLRFNKTDRHDIAEIALKVALKTITLSLTITLQTIRHSENTFYSRHWQVGQPSNPLEPSLYPCLHDTTQVKISAHWFGCNCLFCFIPVMYNKMKQKPKSTLLELF